MYKEGRQFVVDAKKEIDGVVGDIKGIQKDAKGIFGFFAKLFATKEKPTVAPVKDKPKKKVEFDENQIYAQVADALTKFFHAYNGLKNYAKEQEEIAMKELLERGYAEDKIKEWIEYIE